jgi:hypothetical protein
VYFTAGPFRESHGLFGSLAAVAPGSPEGPAESQSVQAHLDVVQIDQAVLAVDVSNGAPAATIKQDTQTLNADFHTLTRAQEAFAEDTVKDTSP